MSQTADMYAQFSAPYADIAALISQKIAAYGFAHEREEGRLWVQLVGGALTLTALPEALCAQGARTRLSVSAPDAAQLQALRDWLSELLGQADAPPLWQGLGAQNRPANHARARLIGCARLSPNFLRVTLEGEELVGFAPRGLHFRLLLGPQGAGEPRLDANGVTVWPQGKAAWHQPVYTIRAFDPARARLEFDVFLHAGGRAADWCAQAALGAAVLLSGPSGDLPKAAGWNGFVGDETALPLIARALETLPATAQGQAVLLVPEAADIQALTHPRGVRVSWLERRAGATALEALAQLTPPERARTVFFAAHAREAQAARQSLAARGFAREEMTALGYWQ